MLATGILLGKLEELTNLEELLVLVREKNFHPASPEFLNEVLYLYESHRKREIPLVPPPFTVTDRSFDNLELNLSLK